MDGKQHSGNGMSTQVFLGPGWASGKFPSQGKFGIKFRLVWGFKCEKPIFFFSVFLILGNHLWEISKELNRSIPNPLGKKWENSKAVGISLYVFPYIPYIFPIFHIYKNIFLFPYVFPYIFILSIFSVYFPYLFIIFPSIFPIFFFTCFPWYSLTFPIFQWNKET